VRIGIDAMGGDHAPDAILTGALGSVDLLRGDDRLVLIGDEAIIRDHIDEAGLAGDARIEIEPTTEVVEMAEPPVAAVRWRLRIRVLPPRLREPLPLATS